MIYLLHAKTYESILVKGHLVTHIKLYVNELVVVDPDNGFGDKPLSSPKFTNFLLSLDEPSSVDYGPEYDALFHVLQSSRECFRQDIAILRSSCYIDDTSRSMCDSTTFNVICIITKVFDYYGYTQEWHRNLCIASVNAYTCGLNMIYKFTDLKTCFQIKHPFVFYKIHKL